MAFGSGFSNDNTAISTPPARTAASGPAVGVGVLAFGDGATSDNNTGLATTRCAAAERSSNIALGAEALDELVTGDNNAALGASALPVLTAGSGNIAVGRSAGLALTSGSNNIYIGNSGAASETGTVRVGFGLPDGVLRQRRPGRDDRPQQRAAGGDRQRRPAGTVSSSRMTKFDIANLDPAVTAAVQRLRAVQFRYLQAFADGSMLLHTVSSPKRCRRSCPNWWRSMTPQIRRR